MSEKKEVGDLAVAATGDGTVAWTEREPYMYVDELSWRRYCPPIPVHAGNTNPM